MDPVFVGRAALCTCAALAVKPNRVDGRNFLHEFLVRVSINAARWRQSH
jgi:hypothetical protein